MKNALITFVKKPILGKTKTRLAATIGDEKALEVYIKLLEHTKKVASLTPADLHVFYAFDIVEDDMWNEDAKHLQIEGELDVKIKAAFSKIFEMGYEKVVIIGSDCAELNDEILEQAFYGLDDHDFVIGPALDGGYYLLGMKSYAPDVFDDIAWSTETVFRSTLDRIGERSCATLPVLSDIDYEEDLKRAPWLLED